MLYRRGPLYPPPQPLDLVSKRLPRAYPLQVQALLPTDCLGANLRFAIWRAQHAATVIPRQTLTRKMQATITQRCTNNYPRTKGGAMQVTCSDKQMGNELTEGAQATSYPRICHDMTTQRQSIQVEMHQAGNYPWTFKQARQCSKVLLSWLLIP